MYECNALCLVAGGATSSDISLIQPPTRTSDTTRLVRSNCLLSAINKHQVTRARVATLDYKFCDCLRSSSTNSTRQSSVSAASICFVQFDSGGASDLCYDVSNATQFEDVALCYCIRCVLRNSGVTIGDRDVVREGCGINFSENCHCSPYGLLCSFLYL